MRRTFVYFLSFLLSAVGVHASVSASDIQVVLDTIAPGEVMDLPEGVITGPLRIPDGVTLRGAGAGKTILDGEGADIVVAFGKETVLIGVTVRNGRHGLHSQGHYIGVFECDIEQTEISGLFMQSGSGVILNNHFRGANGRGTGIFIVGANPYIANNLFEDYAVAIRATHNFIPTIMNNWFRNNRVGIDVSHGAKLVLGGNVFDNNPTPVKGWDLSPTDVLRALDPAVDVLVRGHGLAGYRAAMDGMFDKMVEQHPAVIYELTDISGAFDVILLFPWASFTMGVSAVQTEILDYAAYDWVADRSLFAERMDDGTRPGVKVDNPDILDQGLDRYILENRFFHEDSYFVNDEGGLSFHRMTTLSRIDVVLPEGYKLVDSNLPADIEEIGSRQKVTIFDVGVTHLRLTLQK